MTASAVQIFKWKQRHRRRQAWFKKARRKEAIAKHRKAEADRLWSKGVRERAVVFNDFVLRWQAAWMGIGIAINKSTVYRLEPVPGTPG